MEAILKIPYSYSDPNHDFDHSQEFAFDGSDECMQQWEKMKQEYETKMVNTYKKYKQVIDRNIHRLGQNIAINNEGEKENNHFQQTRTYITETIAKIHDMYNQPISIDTLIDYYKNGDMFILDIQLPVYEHNDILESEVKSWIKETLKINREPMFTDEERLMGYTARDFKLEFPNSKSSAILQNTKMLDIVNNHTFAFLVEKIIFLKNN